MDTNTKTAIVERGGFIRADEIDNVIAMNRHARVHVKCSCTAFTCQAQFAEKLISYVDNDDDDYVRTVELVDASEIY